MSLWFVVMVNDKRIGSFSAQRREKRIPGSRICTYDVTVNGPLGERSFVVRHDYDAGAFALVRRALIALDSGGGEQHAVHEEDH